MASINGYPHVEMHVRDDSIYIPSEQEILPLGKPLYMMRAQRGPIGVPVWCPTYTDAVRVFGADTFNKRSKYFSESAYFLLKCFPFNGAFIMRVASEEAKPARISIEVGLSKSVDENGLPNAAVPQWKRDTNGNFELELSGARIPINEDGLTEEELAAKNEAEGTSVEFVQATLPGLKLAWRATIRPNDGDPRTLGTVATAATENFVWYPLIDVEASNPGAWGAGYGIKLFFDPNVNTLAGTIRNGAATYSIAPVELLQDATVATPVVDQYGQSVVTGVLKPNVIDADTEVDLSIDKRVKRAYAGRQALPLNFTYLSDNWNTVGKMVMKAEIAVRTAAYNLYKDAGLDSLVVETTEETTGTDGDGNPIVETVEVRGVRTFVDDLFSKVADASDIGGNESEVGFMANIASCTDYQGVPFFATEVIGSTDDLLVNDSRLGDTDPENRPNTKDIVIPSSDQSIFLGGGTDGAINDWNIEEYLRAQIRSAIAGTQDYLNDYWHCPFNRIYDVGYTLKTKKALIDFTAVRDNLVAVISSQITAQKDASDINPPVANSRMDDEAVAASLRAYALLMREDVENATGACRIFIFTAAGKTSDHDDRWVAYTLWYALKDAEYLNKPYIDQEPKELPYSSVECFTDTSWTAAQEETKSRVWNSGVNYVQYYNMTGIHFAAVRSVYWYETSVLVDAGTVNALTFTKDIIRRSWSTWAGSTRRAAELNKLITDDVDSREAYMLHDKFRHKVRVYQTVEDMNLGYQRHVDVELWASPQNRVWKATVICKREGYNDQNA